jgi:hypothetical protein
MVRPERFELPTYCSGGNRSIQLSYGRAVELIMNYTYLFDLGSFSRFVQCSLAMLACNTSVGTPLFPRDTEARGVGNLFY